jgi:hypothetical protein
MSGVQAGAAAKSDLLGKILPVRWVRAVRDGSSAGNGALTGFGFDEREREAAMIRALTLVLLICPALAMAGGTDGAGLAPATARSILRNLDAYLDDATEVIAGYGTDGRLGPDGIALKLAAARAQARALALLPLMAADLDGDGMVAAAELAQAGAIGSAWERGRLQRAAARADLDGQPGLGAAELAAFGQRAADTAVSASQVARLQALMQFDQDGDGAVTRDEVKSGLEALARQMAKPAPQAKAGDGA